MLRKSLLSLVLACSAFSLQADVIEVSDESTLQDHIKNSDKPVVVKFFAEWCGPCKQLKPIYHEVAEENPDKAVFIAVDADNEFVSKYNVKGLPTLVFYKNGKEANRLQGIGQKAKEKILSEIAKVSGGKMSKEKAPMKKMAKKKPAKKMKKEPRRRRESRKQVVYEDEGDSGCKSCNR